MPWHLFGVAVTKKRKRANLESKKPPDDCEKGGHDPAKTKAELIKYLKGSFDYSNRVIASLTTDNALDRINGDMLGQTRNSVFPWFQFGM